MLKVTCVPYRLDDGAEYTLFTNSEDYDRIIYYQALDHISGKISYRFSKDNYEILLLIWTVIEDGNISDQCLAEVAKFHNMDRDVLFANIRISFNTS